jgi:hypothetical protein
VETHGVWDSRDGDSDDAYWDGFLLGVFCAVECSAGLTAAQAKVACYLLRSAMAGSSTNSRELWEAVRKVVWVWQRLVRPYM